MEPFGCSLFALIVKDILTASHSFEYTKMGKKKKKRESENWAIEIRRGGMKK